PERIAVGGDAQGLHNHFQARVEHASYLGAILDIDVSLSGQDSAGSDRMLLQIPNKAGVAEPKPGETITIGWAEDAGLVYPREA
ncbi:MAG: hypothetical protein DCF30_15765, partial [Hyphomicrobiales bacterium]